MTAATIKTFDVNDSGKTFICNDVATTTGHLLPTAGAAGSGWHIRVIFSDALADSTFTTTSNIVFSTLGKLAGATSTVITAAAALLAGDSFTLISDGTQFYGIGSTATTAAFTSA
ncbi:MAG: hypothetical protein N2B06_16875 [Clostridium sp.]